MILYLVRHASAGQRKSSDLQDQRRPLDDDGIQQCREMGRALAAFNLDVEAIYSSPLKRATQTASLLANEMGHEGKVQLTPALLPEASFADFQRLLDKNLRLESMMVVGHNPSLSAFTSLLLSDGAIESAVDLKKGATAKLEITNLRKPATLSWCLTPKLVHAVYEAAPQRAKATRK